MVGVTKLADPSLLIFSTKQIVSMYSNVEKFYGFFFMWFYYLEIIYDNWFLITK